MNSIKFEFTIEQTNMIMAALVRLPYEAVAPLIAEIQKQADSQVKNMPREVGPPPDKL